MHPEPVWHNRKWPHRKLFPPVLKLTSSIPCYNKAILFLHKFYYPFNAQTKFKGYTANHTGAFVLHVTSVRTRALSCECSFWRTACHRTTSKSLQIRLSIHSVHRKQSVSHGINRECRMTPTIRTLPHHKSSSFEFSTLIIHVPAASQDKKITQKYPQSSYAHLIKSYPQRGSP